jgi:hypothetical protein
MKKLNLELLFSVPRSAATFSTGRSPSPKLLRQFDSIPPTSLRYDLHLKLTEASPINDHSGENTWLSES